MEKIAILGSNSFSGSHLVNYFLENTDSEVIGISRSSEYPPLFLPYLYMKNRSSRFKFFQLNINTQLPEIIRLFDSERPETIVNFAAQGNVQYSWSNPVHWLNTNTIGVANLAFSLKNREYLEKFVQISTPEIYGLCNNLKEDLNCYNPSTPYAVSKVAGDLFLSALYKKFNFPVCFVRSSNFYGIHQQLYRIIPKTVICLKNGVKIPLHGGGVAQRDFIHIKDVLDGMHMVISRGANGSVYHFSSGKILTIRNLVKFICRSAGYNFEDSVAISDDRADQDAIFGLSSSKAKEEFGWQPRVKLGDGINEVVKWIENNWEEILKYPLEYIHQE